MLGSEAKTKAFLALTLTACLKVNEKYIFLLSVREEILRIYPRQR